MALSAIADLARPSDRELILKLDAYMRDLGTREDSKTWLPASDDRRRPREGRALQRPARHALPHPAHHLRRRSSTDA